MKSDWCSAGIPFYRTREIVKLHECGSVDNDLFISKEYFNRIKHDFGVPKTNDIMLTAVGTIGIPYIVKEDDCFYYKDASVLCLRNFYKLNSKFFFFLILSSELREQMFSASKGTTVDTVTIEKANDYIFMLPPLKEQERIVNVIESYLSIINDLESNLQYLHDCVSITKSKILDLAMRGKLVPQDPADEPAADMLRRINHKAKIIGDNPHYPQLPSGWCIATINDVFEINPKNKANGDMEAGFVPMTSICDGFNNSFVHTPRKWDEIKNGFTHFADGDIAVAKISPCLENRKSMILKNLPNGIGSGTTELLVFRSKVIYQEYGLLFFKSDNFIKQCVGTFNGVVGQQRVSKNIVEEIPIPIPPYKAQMKIANEVNRLFETLDQINSNLAN